MSSKSRDQLRSIFLTNLEVNAKDFIYGLADQLDTFELLISFVDKLLKAMHNENANLILAKYLVNRIRLDVSDQGLVTDSTLLDLDKYDVGVLKSAGVSVFKKTKPKEDSQSLEFGPTMIDLHEHARDIGRQLKTRERLAMFLRGLDDGADEESMTLFAAKFMVNELALRTQLVPSSELLTLDKDDMAVLKNARIKNFDRRPPKPVRTTPLKRGRPSR